MPIINYNRALIKIFQQCDNQLWKMINNNIDIHRKKINLCVVYLKVSSFRTEDLITQKYTKKILSCRGELNSCSRSDSLTTKGLEQDWIHWCPFSDIVSTLKDLKNYVIKNCSKPNITGNTNMWVATIVSQQRINQF